MPETSSIFVLILLFLFCIWQVRRDYEIQKTLAAKSVVAVWVLYVLHASMTFYAAIGKLWPIGLVPFAKAMGALVLLFGLVMTVAGLISLQSIKRMSGMEANKLIVLGAYRWSRNPQNVGWGILLTGVSIYAQSGFAMLLSILFWMMFRFYVPIEEKYLERIFGESYSEYKLQVFRYLGKQR